MKLRVYDGSRLVYTKAEEDQQRLRELEQNRVTATAYIRVLLRRQVELQDQIAALELKMKHQVRAYRTMLALAKEKRCEQCVGD